MILPICFTICFKKNKNTNRSNQIAEQIPNFQIINRSHNQDSIVYVQEIGNYQSDNQLCDNFQNKPIVDNDLPSYDDVFKNKIIN